MSAGNDTRSAGDGLDGGHNGTPGPLVDSSHAGSGAHTGGLEIVWSSPVSTGSGWGLADGSALAKAAAVDSPDVQPDWPSRHIVAFESDLLDSAFLHWEQERPTLEMIAGYKQDAPHEPEGHPAESVASGQAQLADELDSVITRVTTQDDTNTNGIVPFQPDTSLGAPGPAAVRRDGIEDPLTGWRPTGMVFFETLSTPPRGTVYSSHLLDAFWDQSQDKVGSAPPSPVTDKHQAAETAPPFFDFPDDVAPALPEDTEDFPLEPIVVKGGSGRGGGGGSFFIRMFGRMVLLGLALVGLAFFAIIGAYFWYAKQRIYDEPAINSGRSVVVTVTPGESFRSVINEMSKDGLLRGFMGLDDRYLMRYLAYFYDNSDKVKPGVYRFPAGESLDNVYRKLIEGSKDYKITVPEGVTAQEIGQLVAKQYNTFDVDHFNQLVNDPVFINSLGIDAPSLEGYLYPSTYYFGPGMKEEELIRLMVSTFKSKLDTIRDKITTDSLTLHEHVIMASLIEREARMDEDRPMIASVIFNRLEKGMPLQIDATVNFALNNWRRLKNSDYQTSHPYNTYKFKGLPPGPITSPRIESLLATYTAPETNYLYYVHKGNGHHAFAETYPQHQANVGRYIRERNTSGMGNVPVAGEVSTADQADAELKIDEQTDDNSDGAAESSEKEPSVATDIEIEPAVEASDDTGDAEPETSAETEKAEPTPAAKSY